MQSNLQQSTSDVDTSTSQSLFADDEDQLASSKPIPVIPRAKWVASDFEASEHIFIASAVLTPVALDRYTGTSRKYSVAY